MNQFEMLQILKTNPNKWFTSKDFKEHAHNTTRKVRRLEKTNLIVIKDEHPFLYFKYREVKS